MYLKHKFYMFLMGLLLCALPLHSKSLGESIKDLFSFKVGQDVFDSINKNIRGSLKAKNIKLTLPNTVEIENMEALDEFGHRVLFSPRVKLTISLISLLTSNIRVSEAFVSEPYFSYVIKNDIQNIVRMFEDRPSSGNRGPKPASQTKITIEKVTCENGRFDMFHDEGVTIKAHGIRANGTFWVEGDRFNADVNQLEVLSGTINALGMILPLKNLVGKNVTISDQVVASDDLILSYENANLRARGQVHIGKRRYDIFAFVDAPEGIYPQGLEPLPLKTPAFSASVKMTGPLVKPEFLAQIKHKNTRYSGLEIKQGTINAAINTDKISIQSANLHIGTAGSVSMDGVIDIDSKKFHFNSAHKDIEAKDLASLFSLKNNVQGTISGDATYEGSFEKDSSHIRVISQGMAQNAALEQINFLQELKFNLDINYLLDKQVQFSKVHLSDNEGLLVQFSGQNDLQKDSLKLNFDAYIKEANKYYHRTNHSDFLKDVSLKGKVSLVKNSWDISAIVKAKKAQLYDVEASDIKGTILMSRNKINSKLTARFYQGSLSTDVVVDDIFGVQKLSGSAFVENARVYSLSRPFLKFDIDGQLSSSLDFSGTLNHPAISFKADVTDLALDKASFHNFQVIGNFRDNIISISKLLAVTYDGMLEGEKISFNVTSKELAGNFNVQNLKIGTFFSTYVEDVDGLASGYFSVAGALKSPKIQASMMVKDMVAHGVRMGDGSMDIELSHQQLLGPDLVNDLVLSVSASLKGKDSAAKIRFSMALNKNTVNAEASFEDLFISTADLKFSTPIGILGRITGTITAQGALHAPFLSADLRAVEYALFDSSLRKEALVIQQYYGPLVIRAQSADGKLGVQLCASFQDPVKGQDCSDDSSLQLSFTGPFSFDEFNFEVTGRLKHDHIEDIIIVLSKELRMLATDTSFIGRVAKNKQGMVSYDLSVTVDTLSSSLPRISSIVLKEPVRIKVSNQGIDLLDKAQFLFADGQLTASGSFTPSNINLNFKGDIPLVLGRFIVPWIQGCEGLAKGDLIISGSYLEPLIEGHILLHKGSLVQMRKWIEPIEVRKGAISFFKNSAHSFTTKFEEIKLLVGDGKLFIEGEFFKQYSNNLKSPSSFFNMRMNGSNIVLRDRFDFIETDFNIETKPNASGSLVVDGNIIVTDGSAYRQFDLRNFVAQAQSSGIKTEFSKIFESVDMLFDLDIAIRQFKASARMLNLEVDSSLRGQLALVGPLQHPKFKGSIFVTEGAIIFPALSFDLMESQVVLDESSSKIFDPKINISATQELLSNPPQVNGDTTIELTLRGDLDRLSLELRPIRGDYSLSQLRIFMILLSPQASFGFEAEDQSEVLKKGAQNAALALSEVFLRPLTNELQDVLENKTRTRLQFGSAIESGGVTLRLNWKLGPRIELQGSYMFMNWDTLKRGENILYYTENSVLGDLKIKLLLFDHRPLGPLFLETSFGSIRHEEQYQSEGKIRLKYRVLSK